MSDIFYRGQFQKVQMGDYGFDLVETSTEVDNRQLYRIITAIADVELSILDIEAGEIKTVSLSTNQALYGRFKEINVTSVEGSVIAYLGNERPLKYTITPQGIIKYLGNTVGDTFEIEGKEYVVVDDTTIRNYDPDVDDMTVLCTTLVTDMSELFEFKSTFNQNIGHWDTSSVTDMSFMFSGASIFNQYIGNWDVSKVTTMSTMFFNANSFNKDLSKWDVSNVTDMNSMFSTFLSQPYRFNQPLNNWDVSSVTNMGYMFGNQSFDEVTTSDFNQPLDNWNMSNVTITNGMFIGSKFNQDISNWDTSNVTNMDFMFRTAINFNQDISNWCVELIATKPADFDLGTPERFTEDKQPNWGVACVV